VNPDLLVAVTPGEPHEQAGLVALERIEELGEYDGKRRPIPVSLADGVGYGASSGVYRIGRAEIVGELAALIAAGRIDATDAPGADALARQLSTFSTAAKRDERHELVDALGLALWWGERRLTVLTKQPVAPMADIDCRPPTFDEAIKLLERA
jgi:hypothetical protein